MNKIFFSCLLLLSLFSCDKDYIEPDIDTSNFVEAREKTEADFQMEKFGGILAKTLYNYPEVRALLKKEALVQFNRDYDVLFNLILDRQVAGSTFESLLIENGASKSELDHLIKDYPLLTIFVPDLPGFSVNTWDTTTEIPYVALGITSSAKVPVINENGEIAYLQNNELPGFPIVVLKNNERVTTSDKSLLENGKKLSPIGTLNKRGAISYYFIDSAFDGTTTETLVGKSALENKLGINLDPTLITAYNSGVRWQRDNIYYGLTPTNTVGPLRNNYSEFITSISMLGDAASAYRKIADQDGDPRHGGYPSNNFWTEGNFEFNITVKINAKNGVGPEIKKVFNVKASDLFDVKYTKGKSCSFWHCKDVWRFTSIANKTVNLNIELVPWDLSSYGFGWLFNISEFDQDQVLTQVAENTTQFATNFKLAPTFGGLEKVGLEFGGSATFTEKESFTVQSTLTSDQLGDATLTFDQPVITKKLSSSTYELREINTGLVSITVYPKKAF